MVAPPDDRSLGDAATVAGAGGQPRSCHDVSLGGERTRGGGHEAGIDTVIDDIEIVDLEARYRAERPLGTGGMGVVQLATDTRLGRQVAIKRIRGEAAGNRMAVARFLTEAKAIAAINHPNVVQIYDYGQAQDGPFLIMEYVDGGSLAERCMAGPIPVDEAIELACQICDGLARAHDQGIIHRDIKPANVLLTRDGVPKLTDFGLAKAHAADHGHSVTGTGAVLGTPDFMPPEQRRDASLVDQRSDLWSVAATVYQMVTGRSPKIIRFTDLPAALEGVLARALEERKDARHQSARELRDALKATLHGGTKVPKSAGELAEGHCPECGTVNADLTRKFCKNCGGALRVACLKCATPIPIWDRICGECGGHQPQLLVDKRTELEGRKKTAEELLAALAFDEAIAAASVVRDESHPGVAALKAWADDFLAEAERFREQQSARASAAVSEALKHEAAHDYAAAVAALGGIAASFRQMSLGGVAGGQTVDAVLHRVLEKQSESRRLRKLIHDRISRRDLANLEPEVDALLALEPHRVDVVKLKGQLAERRRGLDERRATAISAARALLERHEYEQAFTSLSQLDSALDNAEIAALRREARARVDEIAELSVRVRSMVAADQVDELLGAVDRLLVLKPNDAALRGHRDMLLSRANRMATETSSTRSRVAELWLDCRFAEAAAVIERIHAAKVPADMRQRLRDCQRMARLRKAALDALQSPPGPGRPPSGEEYRAELARHGLTDREFTQLHDAARTAAGAASAPTKIADRTPAPVKAAALESAVEPGSARETAQQWSRRQSLIAAGIVLAVAVLWLFGGGGSEVRQAGEVRVGNVRGAGTTSTPNDEGAKDAARAGDRTTAGDPPPAASSSGPEPAVAARNEPVPPPPPRQPTPGEILQSAPIENSIGMKLKRLPAGTFVMGDSGGEAGETPHRVTLTKPFYCGIHEVTNSQWSRVMGSPTSRRNEPDLPVESLTWDDAVEFCRRLSALPGERSADRLYRLPTEAEWEYACRAGTTTRYSFGDDVARIGHYGWFDGNAQGKTHPVGGKEPNPWGIYDLHGNVREWCRDLYEAYDAGDAVDPQGPSRGQTRVARGGSWLNSPPFCRSTIRFRMEPSIRYDALGFRVVMEQPGSSGPAAGK